MTGAWGADAAFGVEADQRLPGELRQGQALAPGPGGPLRARLGRAGLRAGRRGDHRHPDRGGDARWPPMRSPGPTRGAWRSSGTASRPPRTCARSARSGRFESVTVWGRSPERGRGLRPAHRARARHPGPCRQLGARRRWRRPTSSAPSPRPPSRSSSGRWVRPGHARQPRRLELPRARSRWTPRWSSASRFIADSREGCLRQGAEFVKAKEAGLIGDDHLVAEIGEVLSGKIPGRRTRRGDHRLQVAGPHRAGPVDGLGAVQPGRGARVAMEPGLFEEIRDACAHLHARGLLAAADGNVSVRQADGSIVLTPAGVNKARLRPGVAGAGHARRAHPRGAALDRAGDAPRRLPGLPRGPGHRPRAPAHRHRLDAGPARPDRAADGRAPRAAPRRWQGAHRPLRAAGHRGDGHRRSCRSCPPTGSCSCRATGRWPGASRWRRRSTASSGSSTARSSSRPPRSSGGRRRCPRPSSRRSGR